MGKGGGDSNQSGMMMAIASVQAAQMAYNLGQQQLNFTQDQWSNLEPLVDQSLQSSSQLQSEQAGFTEQEQNFYTQNYQPLESTYLNQVENYDSPAQESINAGAAEQNVNDQFTQQRSAAAQTLEAYGVNPTSTRFASLDMGSRDQQAAAAAGAGTSSIQQTKLAGLGLEAGAINTGRGYANNSAPLANSSTAAGSAATSGALGSVSTMAGALSSPTAWFNAGANNMNTYVNAVNGFNSAQAQEDSANSGMLGGIGSAAGGILGMLKLADGGPIPTAAPAPTGAPTTGGAIPPQSSPSGGQATDDVPAMLTSGEFVIPRDVVQWEGEKSMYGMIDKARQTKQKLQQTSPVGGRPVAAIPSRPNFVSRPMPTQTPIPVQAA